MTCRPSADDRRRPSLCLCAWVFVRVFALERAGQPAGSTPARRAIQHAPGMASGRARERSLLRAHAAVSADGGVRRADAPWGTGRWTTRWEARTEYRGPPARDCRIDTWAHRWRTATARLPPGGRQALRPNECTCESMGAWRPSVKRTCLWARLWRARVNGEDPVVFRWTCRLDEVQVPCAAWSRYFADERLAIDRTHTSKERSAADGCLYGKERTTVRCQSHRLDAPAMSTR
jgi:hypothetical protein